MAEAPKRATWNNNETHTLLDFLIENKNKLTGNGGFPFTVFQAASQSLDIGKSSPAIQNKWQSLKRLHSAIEDYVRKPGNGAWDDEAGANIQDNSSQLEVWMQQVPKELLPYRKKGWPFYRKMKEVYQESASPVQATHESMGVSPFPIPRPGQEYQDIESDGIASTSESSLPPDDEMSLDSQWSNCSTGDFLADDQSGGNETVTVDLQGFGFDFDHVLKVIPGITSPDVQVQQAAVQEIVSTLGQATSGHLRASPSISSYQSIPSTAQPLAPSISYQPMHSTSPSVVPSISCSSTRSTSPSVVPSVLSPCMPPTASSILHQSHPVAAPAPSLYQSTTSITAPTAPFVYQYMPSASEPMAPSVLYPGVTSMAPAPSLHKSTSPTITAPSPEFILSSQPTTPYNGCAYSTSVDPRSMTSSGTTGNDSSFDSSKRTFSDSLTRHTGVSSQTSLPSPVLSNPQFPITSRSAAGSVKANSNTSQRLSAKVRATGKAPSNSSQRILAKVKAPSNPSQPQYPHTPSIDSHRPGKRGRAAVDSDPMTNAAAMMGMVGAIHHTSDMLKIAMAAPSQASETQDYIVTAARLLDADQTLSVEVRSFVALEMVKSDVLCKFYANTSTPEIRHALALQIYNAAHPNEGSSIGMLDA